MLIWKTIGFASSAAPFPHLFLHSCTVHSAECFSVAVNPEYPLSKTSRELCHYRLCHQTRMTLRSKQGEDMIQIPNPKFTVYFLIHHFNPSICAVRLYNQRGNVSVIFIGDKQFSLTVLLSGPVTVPPQVYWQTPLIFFPESSWCRKQTGDLSLQCSPSGSSGWNQSSYLKLWWQKLYWAGCR